MSGFLSRTMLAATGFLHPDQLLALERANVRRVI